VQAVVRKAPMTTPIVTKEVKVLQEELNKIKKVMVRFLTHKSSMLSKILAVHLQARNQRLSQGNIADKTIKSIANSNHLSQNKAVDLGNTNNREGSTRGLIQEYIQIIKSQFITRDIIQETMVAIKDKTALVVTMIEVKKEVLILRVVGVETDAVVNQILWQMPHAIIVKKKAICLEDARIPGKKENSQIAAGVKEKGEKEERVQELNEEITSLHFAGLVTIVDITKRVNAGSDMKVSQDKEGMEALWQKKTEFQEGIKDMKVTDDLVNQISLILQKFH
jgi:hypothetical protein